MNRLFCSVLQGLSAGNNLMAMIFLSCSHLNPSSVLIHHSSRQSSSKKGCKKRPQLLHWQRRDVCVYHIVLHPAAPGAVPSIVFPDAIHGPRNPIGPDRNSSQHK